jgi:competence ComEA-like helix-hairpin-helix protein
MVIAGVAYQEYRGAPKTAEVIVTHRGATPFDAPNEERAPFVSPTLPYDVSPPTQFLNRASKDELMALPGVGEAIAGRIIAYRERFGPFRRLADLLEVEGIGASRLESIEQHVRASLGENQPPPRALPGSRTYAPARIQAPAAERGKTALNLATREQLMEASGIGPSLADRILAERERRGRQGFQSWDDVDAISGIGPVRLEVLQERFTVGNR